MLNVGNCYSSEVRKWESGISNEICILLNKAKKIDTIAKRNSQKMKIKFHFFLTNQCFSTTQHYIGGGC